MLCVASPDSTRAYFMSHNDMENMSGSYWLMARRGGWGIDRRKYEKGEELFLIYSVQQARSIDQAESADITVYF